MPRRSRTAIATSTLVTLAVIALAACQPSPSAPSQTPTSTSTSSHPSPSITSTSPEDVAISDAEKVVKNYFFVSDTALQAPDNFNPEDLKKVAITTALADAQNLFEATKKQGLHQTGATIIESMTNPRVDLKEDAATTPPTVPLVQLDVCYDVSKLNIVDGAGKSIVPAERKARGVARVGVAKYPGNPWLVAFVDYEEDRSC